jgi:hypothetical protein
MIRVLQQLNTRRSSFRPVRKIAKKCGYEFRHAGLSVRMELGMKFDLIFA